MQEIYVSLESPAIPAGSIQLFELRGSEAIGKFFDFEVRLVRTSQEELDEAALLSNPAALVFARSDQIERRIFGTIQSVRDALLSESDHLAYTLAFVPRAWPMIHHKRSEIFLDTAIPDIIKTKLQRAGLDLATDCSFRLTASYPTREFVMQYEETDLAFCSRLCEHLGISFFFEHDSGKDVIVFSDDNSGFRPIEGHTHVTFHRRGAAMGVHQLEVHVTSLPARYTLKDYNYRTPTVSLVAQAAVLPSAPEPVDPGDIDVSRTVDVHGAVDLADETEAPLPVVTTREALEALDSSLIASADAETVKFLLDSAKAKLWRHAYREPDTARGQASSFKGDVYSSHVRDLFLEEFDAAKDLKPPKGYSFRAQTDGPVIEPNLMQRRVAVCVRQARRFGNWSGMGAGKTLSAILATRVVGAGLTVICCPNSVVATWEREINNAFSTSTIQTKTWTPTWEDPLGSSPRYLILNYEQFQQPESEERLVAFLDKNYVDFVVIDEIHFTKQRNEGVMSKRKRLVQGLVLEAGKKNAELCVLGMSGTPVINTLQEGKSLVEMITGHRHDDLETAATVQNCMRLYQRLVTLGTRWNPDYAIQLDKRQVEIDCAPDLEEIRQVGRGTILDLEQVLTRLRLSTILENIKPGEKVLIYTHFVEEIAKELYDAVRAAGCRAGLFTGDVDDTDLKEFVKPHGAVDVLVASSRISTGIDGLQHVCNKLIINCLPWTNAEFDQLIGRIYRQGSKFERVEVIIPVTFAMVHGERWSYCESKLRRLEYKKSIADAAVDGVVPEGNLRTPSQAQQDIMRWLERLEDGAVETLERKKIVIPLSGEPSEVKRRVAAYGDFTRINNRWYASTSDRPTPASPRTPKSGRIMTRSTARRARPGRSSRSRKRSGGLSNAKAWSSATSAAERRSSPPAPATNTTSGASTTSP